jgi:hypothetical protein
LLSEGPNRDPVENKSVAWCLSFIATGRIALSCSRMHSLFKEIVHSFSDHLLRKALPAGARACKSTINRSASYVAGVVWKRLILTFSSPPWFDHPWYIRADVLILCATSLSDILLRLINMNHPNATLPNVLTFRWCLLGI